MLILFLIYRNNDWILTKSNHISIMIEKNKKAIIKRREYMGQDFEDIENYLEEVKRAVRVGRYRIDRNRKRQRNLALYRDYVIDETKSKEIILRLTAYDFCKIVQNEHKGNEHELLYIFGKNVKLLQRMGTEEEIVPLYIKFNKLENQFVIVISFHKQAYPLTYAFK